MLSLLSTFAVTDCISSEQLSGGFWEIGFLLWDWESMEVKEQDT